MVGPEVVAAREQPGRDQLLEHRTAEIEGDPGVHQPVEHALRASHPADPQAAPEGLAGAAERHRLGCEGGERLGHRPLVEPERLVRLVDDRHRADPPQERGVLLALGVGHQVAGGVLEVGDQVGELGPRLAHDPVDRVEVPAVDVHRYAGQPRAGAAQRLEGVGIARRLDEHAVTSAHQALRHDGEGRQGAGHDHDLGRVGRQSARVVRRGDGLLERGDAGGEVAVPAEVAREVLDGVGVRRADAGQCRRGGAGEVDDVVARGLRVEGAVEPSAAPAGQPGVGAGALSGLGEAALDQPGVRAGDGRPREARGRR